MLVAHSAAWRTGRRLVSIVVVRGIGLGKERLLLVIVRLAGGRRGLASGWWFSVRTLGTVFQVPAGGRPIDRPLMCKTNGLGSQRVIGYVLRLLLCWCLRSGMPGALFFHGGHCYPSSPICCIVLPACRGECPSLPPPTASRFCCTSWVRCQRRCCCAIAWLIKPRLRSRMAGLHCCSSLARFSSHITTRLHWRLGPGRASIACPYHPVAFRGRHLQ